LDDFGAPLLERGDLVGAVGAVLLVDDHFAPVFDDQIARRTNLIAKKRRSQVGPSVAVQGGPPSPRPLELPELFLPYLDDGEFPNDGDHVAKSLSRFHPEFARSVGTHVAVKLL